MIAIGNGGGAGYHFGNGLESPDGDERARGMWAGEGAKMLGLKGKVRREVYDRLLQGKDESGRLLLKAAKNVNRRPVLGVVASPPKAIGCLIAKGDPKVTTPVLSAVQGAVHQVVVPYLEEAAGFVRRGKGGKSHEKAGLVIAVFDDLYARPQGKAVPDPLPHTHLEIVNIGVKPDGKCLSLATRKLFQHAGTVSALYDLEVSYRLEKSLGVRIERRGKSYGIEGVPAELEQAFSLRSEAMKARLSVVGGTSHHAKKIAALETRGGKLHAPPMEEIRSSWKQTAERHGLDLSKVIGQERPDRDFRQEFMSALMTGIKNASAKRSTFTESRLLREVAIAAIGRGFSADHVRDVVGTTLRYSREIVRLQEKNGQTVYTTKKLLREERAVKDSARYLHLIKRQGVNDAAITRQTTTAGGKRPLPGMTRAEVEAVRHLTGRKRSNLRVVAAKDPESLEKVLGRVTSILRGAKYEVINVVPHSRNVKAMAKKTATRTVGAGVVERTMKPSFTERLKHHARMLARAAEKKPTWRMTPFIAKKRTAVIVREPEKLSTKELHSLLRAAAKSGALLIMAGEEKTRRVRPRTVDVIKSQTSVYTLDGERKERKNVRPFPKVEKTSDREEKREREFGR